MQDKNGSKFGEKASDILVCVYIAYHITNQAYLDKVSRILQVYVHVTFFKNCCLRQCCLPH